MLTGKLGKVWGLKGFITLWLDREIPWQDLTLPVKCQVKDQVIWLEQVKFVSGKIVIKFVDLVDPNLLEQFVNQTISLDLVIDLLHPWVGKKIWVQDKEIGSIEDVQNFGAGDVLLINLAEDVGSNQVLLPLSPDLISENSKIIGSEKGMFFLSLQAILA